MGILSSIMTNLLKDFIIKNISDDKSKILKKNQCLPIVTEKTEKDNELEQIRKRIAKNKEFPAAEKITFTIYPRVHNILLLFFPNSFKNDKEAYDYYIKFCQKAKDLGEDEKIYKEEKLLKEGITIEIELDMLTGMKKVWNYANNNSYLPSSFTFFNCDTIKNCELKQEIVQLYNDNWNFLTEIGLCYNWSDGLKKIGYQSIDIMPYGLDYLIFARDYHKFQFWMQKNRDIFHLPVDDIICALRKSQTYYLRDNENEQLKQNIKKQNYKNILNFEIDFENNNAQISNKYVSVFINVEYYKPALVTSDDFERPIYYIYPFDVKGFYGV